LLKNIGNQLENLNMEISGLQTKLSNAENRISYMSESQSSLINKMAAKPEDIFTIKFLSVVRTRTLSCLTRFMAQNRFIPRVHMDRGPIKLKSFPFYVSVVSWWVLGWRWRLARTA
jgi:hypothetical protein